MRKGRKSLSENEVPEGAPEWMTTYSDLVTLLLTFFILLFSMASIDKTKFEQVAESLRTAFLSMSNGEIMYENNGKDVLSVSNGEDEEGKKDDKDSEAVGKEDKEKKEKEMQDFQKELENLIISMDLGEYVKIIDEKYFVTLRVDSVILFDSGKANIKDSAREPLTKVGSLLRTLKRNMVVQGHTDTIPINTLLFPTNWELSTKRATNVVLFLVNDCKMDPTVLTATGNGEFRPIAPNDTEVNRAKNRRIDIVIEK
jgi:chemotaxis protein MotB